MAEFDAHGHERGCKNYDVRAPFADNYATHVDLFCDCHHFTEPVLLENGTDIAWPAGWDEVKATEWRKRHALERAAKRK